MALSKAVLSSIILSLCLSLSATPSNAIAAEQEEKPIAEKVSTESNSDKASANESNPASEAAKNKQQKRIINAPVDAFKQQQLDIKHYLDNDNIEQILVGTDEFIMLTNKHTTAINKGVMILVPDWQQSAASSNAIKQLRENMPKQGWTTLTLHPPHQPGNYPSHALDLSERIKENNASLTEYQQLLSKVMTAVTNKAKNYPGVILVVAEGQHAALMVDMVQNKLIDSPSALVMLSSYMPTAAENTKLAEQVAISDYPVLDLYLKRDNYLVLANTKNRSARVKNEMKVYYRQNQLTNQVTGYYPKYSLTRAILGWLSSIGW